MDSLEFPIEYLFQVIGEEVVKSRLLQQQLLERDGVIRLLEEHNQFLAALTKESAEKSEE